MMDKTKIKTIYPKASPVPTGMQQMSGGGAAGRTRGTPAGRSNGTKKQKTQSIAKARSGQFGGDKPTKQTGHRPVTSCTFCRQHKIKCNASENYPNPCQRCDKMGLKCEIDPQFRPKKGSQIQSLKSDVDELKAKIEMLTKNETLLTQALNQHNLNYLQQMPTHNSSPRNSTAAFDSDYSSHGNTPMSFPSKQSPHTFASGFHKMESNHNSTPTGVTRSHMLNDSTPNPTSTSLSNIMQNSASDYSPILFEKPSEEGDPNLQEAEEFPKMDEFVLGDVCLSLEVANNLHDRFVTKYLPFLPIISTNSATELYHKSQLLFWSVILTAALSDPEPTLYMSLASLIKQLAIETCWIRTPRSTHVIQALVILSVWPLPNEKVLDDCSYRFTGLAKNLSLQLGLHRGGEFILEFSRTQVSLGPNAECWRTRTWLAVFFCEQFWSSVLGLPPLINTTDYLLENARVDQTLPKNFRCLISLSIFQCKLVNVMGISVTRPDGLLEPLNRAGSLNILDKELERLKFKLALEIESPIEIYYLYLKLMICCFAFLPGTPIEDQVKYVSSAYLSATRVITIVSQMINNNTMLLIELPIYVRQAVTYSVLLLFKLHLSRYLMEKFVDSARQLIVTVHRLFRNTLSSWKDLQNDISRTAKVLENLNIVLYTCPEVFFMNENQVGGSIIAKMRSHLTASLFYDLVWCIHEARRVTSSEKNNSCKTPKQEAADANDDEENPSQYPNGRKPLPLPFYNQITKDDFKTITTTTPNGTTVTTLVPTDQALTAAKLNASANGLNKPLEINGIPLAMLEATGSVKDIGAINNKTQEPTQRYTAIAPQIPLVAQNEYSNTNYQVPLEASLQKTMFLPSQELLEVLNFSPAPSTNVNLQYGVNGNDDAAFSEVADQMDTFFQQQSNGWLNNDNYQDDDFLGWFDTNLMPDT